MSDQLLNALNLPIISALPRILSALSKQENVILEASAGAGKTTVVPLAVLDQDWLRARKVLVIVPRRVAAKTAAQRMANILREELGQTVGYRVRHETKVGAKTQIELITTGVYLRMLNDNPGMEGVGLVVFDEFHERSVEADLCFSLSLFARDLFCEGSEVKILVMSATLKGLALEKVLDQAPVISCEGRMYPVDIIYGKAASLNKSNISTVVQAIVYALKNEQGSILVFLPGEKEIKQVSKLLEPVLDSPAEEEPSVGPINTSPIELFPLYGSLSFDLQNLAIAPFTDKNRRKIVLATDIAETSLTIEGIRVVIDSGRCRSAVFDPNTGMTRLQTRTISASSAIQRAGRAGRLEEGVCYRLWTEQQQVGLQVQSPAQILQSDLTDLALQMIRWGIDKPHELSWLDAPPNGAYEQSLDLLKALGAITDPAENAPCSLTARGEAMSMLSAHPRLANMMIEGLRINRPLEAARLAALLNERSTKALSDDIARQYILAFEGRVNKSLRGWHKRVEQQAIRYLRELKTIQSNKRPLFEKSDDDPIAQDDIFGLLLSYAYPDRIAKLVGNDQYLLSNKRRAQIFHDSDLSGSPWLVIGNLGGFENQAYDRVFSAVALNPNLMSGPLSMLCRETSHMAWDKQAERFIAQKRIQLGAITVASEPLAQVDPDHKRQALISLLREQGLYALLPWDEHCRQWWARVQYFLGCHSDQAIDDSWLLASLDTWLGPYLESVTVLADFQKIPLLRCLKSLLDWQEQKKLEALFPSHCVVPSGSSIAIDYTCDPPVLSVKLQEMFGCEKTPAVNNGQLKLLVHLLSPARRPLQVTQDLEGFWATSYQDVKKEMKGRYPKHPWPDNPVGAVATRYTKKNRSRD